MKRFDTATFHEHLGDCPIGADLRYFAEVSSTNLVAREILRVERERPDAGREPTLEDADVFGSTPIVAGPTARHGMVVLAEYQSAGRGRLNRRWSAPRYSSLLQSVALLQTPEWLPGYTVMLAALAVRDAVLECTGLAAEVKWPNDILLSGKKICGILAESVDVTGKRFGVLGIGLNVNFDPGEHAEIPVTATSLRHEYGGTLSREILAASLYRSIDRWYGAVIANPAGVFAEWKRALSLVDRRIEVEDASGRWPGTVIDVQRDGSLLVQREGGGTQVVYAATISVRPEDGFTTG